MTEEERERSRHICRDFGDFSPGENGGEVDAAVLTVKAE